MPVKKIYKYPTGASVPDSAVYLSTVKQSHVQSADGTWHMCYLVWHYFLVSVDE